MIRDIAFQAQWTNGDGLHPQHRQQQWKQQGGMRALPGSTGSNVLMTSSSNSSIWGENMVAQEARPPTRVATSSRLVQRRARATKMHCRSHARRGNGFGCAFALFDSSLAQAKGPSLCELPQFRRSWNDSLTAWFCRWLALRLVFHVKDYQTTRREHIMWPSGL